MHVATMQQKCGSLFKIYEIIYLCSRFLKITEIGWATCKEAVLNLKVRACTHVHTHKYRCIYKGTVYRNNVCMINSQMLKQIFWMATKASTKLSSYASQLQKLMNLYHFLSRSASTYWRPMNKRPHVITLVSILFSSLLAFHCPIQCNLN